jgi:ABC-type nitrate/sulfonate/bicarbonate transport system substrate-binding protein
LVISNTLENLGASLFTRQEVIDTQPELVSEFVRGWLKAHQKFVTDIEQVISIHREAVTSFDEELARATLGPIYASRVPSKEIGTEYGKGWTPPEQLENTQDVFYSAGVLQEKRPIDEYYTNRFIDQNRERAVETAQIYYEELEENYEIGPNYV